MYNKEESKTIRQEFWDGFKRYTAKKRRRAGKKAKWMMDATGIKAINLKFHFDREEALVAIDIETASMDRRLELYEKMEALKKLLDTAMETKMAWELDYTRENGKSVSRIFTSLDKVDIYNRECWPQVMAFFYVNMDRLEDFFAEYKDYLS